MSMILRERHGDTLIMMMNRPKVNALNESLVHDLRMSIALARAEDNIRSVVLTSNCPGYFSVGLDFRQVFDYDRETMGHFWKEFRTVYEELHELPKPTVAALNGHTVAGGLILALACDMRVMAKGESTLAVSGINMGLALPDRVYSMAVQAVGHGFAKRLFLTGESIDAQQGHEIGLVDELVDADEVQPHALRLAENLGAKSPSAIAALKEMSRRQSGYDDAPEPDEQAFLDRWFSEESRSIRDALAASIGSAP